MLRSERKSDQKRIAFSLDSSVWKCIMIVKVSIKTDPTLLRRPVQYVD